MNKINKGIARKYKELEMMPEALEECSIAARIDKEDGDIRNILGDCFYSIGLYSSAYKCYSKAIVCEKNNKRSYSYYMMGKIFMDSGVWCRAMSSYAKALQLDPGLDEARRGLEEVGISSN